MRKVFVLGIIGLVFTILLTACGAKTQGDSTTLDIEMSEFMFTPASATIPAGQQITLKLKNSGSIQHDFIILKKGAVVTGSFDHNKQMDDMFFHAMLDAGKANTFTFTAPAEAGEYQIVCGIAGHFQAGMIGKLMVVAP